MRIAFIILFLSFSMIYNSGMCQVNEEGIMESQVEQILKRADSVFNSREYEKSREIYLEAADAASEANDNAVLTQAYAQVARTYSITGNNEEAVSWLEKAEKFASPEEPSGWSRYLGVRGRIERHTGKDSLATSTFEEMYHYCSEKGLHERAIDAAHMLAITGDYEHQIKWAKKAIAEAEKGDIGRWLGPLWNNLGATYEDMHEYAEALSAYRNARDYHYEYGNEMNRLIADWAVAHALRLNRQYDEAESKLDSILTWAKRIDAGEFTGWSYNDLGEIAMAREDYDKAFEYLTQAREQLKEAGMPDWAPEMYQELLDKIEKARIKSQ